ncbi:23S rRNA (adenine(2503)-C(2))-methyltransferase RlmN [Cyanobium sp. Morenito 9A2]|uniref:23S rRNA (adenine(2503)-C(2))-methyltransferase RlmN n=1 Tax=Cyanobium sp. Morenito 9A2 TaxID=2823718 RepID=UPI0020CB7217|nr:23S rRNA (adenine(2503)-C(2))-methyltransferase RlmN [Cyanobium sp. Morenito 9A2]MCP9849172.1 23S rRNA (adenine(2503)-C(2))-methyltransferase RlmN [Cyanobium sp. Morenito 9A2]
MALTGAASALAEAPPPLLGLGPEALEAWAQAEGQPAFRGRQLHDWIYAKGARDLGGITVLPKLWRERLIERELAHPGAGSGLIGRSRELTRSVARDGTTKLLLATHDGLSLETVGIPATDRLTVCVSSQVGCPMACRFCATGKGGLQRSLAVHEIVDQVLSVREVMGERPSHVVFMGMGEPLLNVEAVLVAVQSLCRDLGMAQRQITISTVGVPRALPELAERALAVLGRAQFTLAVSLHAPDQALREELIPTARAYPIETLLEDCRRYVAITGRRVSFEYILLGGVNDQPRHADALAQRLRGFQSHVNLIAYNPIEEEEFQRPSPQRVQAFKAVLERRHVAVSVRASRGLDADAACGQLRRRASAGVALGIEGAAGLALAPGRDHSHQ